MSSRRHKKKKKIRVERDGVAIQDDNYSATELSCQEHLKHNGEISKPHDSKVALWTLFTAIAVAVIYALQLNAMIDSNKINREALESVQRAFVVFSPTAEIGTSVNQQSKVIAWQAHVPMKNAGATSTKKLRNNISFYISKTSLPDDFGFPDTSDVISGVLGPKDEIQLRTQNIPIADVVLAQQNLTHIYVYGWAAYRDVFPESPPHLTMFCYELFLNTIPGDLTSIDYKLTGSFLTCKKHNCQDDECRNEALPTGIERPN